MIEIQLITENLKILNSNLIFRVSCNSMAGTQMIFKNRSMPQYGLDTI